MMMQSYNGEEDKKNKLVRLATEELTGVFRKICDIKSPAEQERIFMELMTKLATFKDIGTLVKALLEAKKVLKIKEVEQEIEDAQEDKTDAEERGEYMSEMLEVISSGDSASQGAKEPVSGGSGGGGGSDTFATI